MFINNIEKKMILYSLTPIEFWILMESAVLGSAEVMDEFVKSLRGSWKTGIPQEQIGNIPMESPLSYSKSLLKNAIVSLVEKGYLYHYNSDTIMICDLLYNPCLVLRAQDMPEIDTIGISPVGEKIAEDMALSLPDKNAFPKFNLRKNQFFLKINFEEGECTYYSNTIQGIIAGILQNGENVNISDVRRIGPWITQRWWRVNPKGFALNIPNCCRTNLT